MLWHTKKDVIIYFIGFLLGPITEIFAIYFGAWEYSRPTFLIPLWLPLLWGMATLSMMKLTEYFTKEKSTYSKKF